MSSVLFLTFLLLEFKLSLFFGFSLLAGSLLAFKLVFFILLLECLLRLGADARFFKLFMRVSLTSFRVVRFLFDLCFDGRAESQVIEMSQDKGENLCVGRLCAEYHSANGEPIADQFLKHAYPKRVVKENRQL